MEREILFIDLDDTLISNEHTKQVLLECLSEVGFTEEEITSRYPEARDSNGFFSPEGYLHALGATPEQEALFEQTWKHHREGIKNGLLPGALSFLTSIDRKRFVPTLLTLGNPSYQQDKVSALGISEHFEVLHFCTEPKDRFLLKLLPHTETFTLIDDREDCRQAVRVAFSNAKTYATFSDFEVAAAARS